MTDTCNLACKYCFVENKIPKNYCFTKMSPKTVRFGLDLFVKSLAQSHGIKEPQIIIYGGEPLINLEAVKETFSYVKHLKMNGKLPKNTSITINTNGTLINAEVIEILKQAENLNVAISLDGPQKINDACRKYHSGLGTYEDILKARHLLQVNGINAGFCCTINKFNVDKLDKISSWFVEKMGAKSLGFNLLIEGGEIEKVRGNINSYAHKTTAQLIKCFKYFRREGVYEDRIMRKVNAFIEGHVYYYDCGGCGQQLVISPDGMVGICQGYCGSKKYFINANKNFNPLDHPNWDLWRHRSPLFMPQCCGCIALSVCGGGCPFRAEVRSGSIWNLDEIFCVHAKKTVQFLIKDLIKEMSKK